ncbi:(2Fe-2S)-binding protein [Desmospora profundinema]|uniref:Sarcosine oxidase subunit alpha n=1 Tax=Desmospora profundinema TaxID=1571184 RepID=A0ABU1IJF4_9BACL|nr:(2Fe-2S)-binding protein [Desmospora profundinema]MDR6224915.1 sarcosine oxidase subunit alpha [Desmospora profundinema]
MKHPGRIEQHPVLGPRKQTQPITFTLNGQPILAYEGETIAASLLANGIRILRSHEETDAPRGIYCNIGHCFECRVKVNGADHVRSCLTLVKEGLAVETKGALPTPLKEEDKR